MTTLLTASQVARELGVAPIVVSRAASAGTVPTAGWSRNRRMYRLDDVRAALAGLPPPDPDLVTADEAAVLVGRPVGTVRCWSSNRRVATVRVNGLLYFRRAEVVAFGEKMNRHRDEEREPTAEEVEAMVEEGYANLPLWWDAETRKATRGVT